METYDLTMKFKNNKVVTEKNISLGKLVHLLCKNDKKVDAAALSIQLQLDNLIIKDGGIIAMPFRKFMASITVHH